MVRIIFLSLAALLVAVGGLTLAGTSDDGSLQAAGIVILLLAWGWAVGYHARRAERVERERLGLPAPKGRLEEILSKEWSMLQSIAVSILFALLGVLGLLMAAGASDSSTQFMGVGILLLSWFLLVGFHARRAENEERARHGNASH